MINSVPLHLFPILINVVTSPYYVSTVYIHISIIHNPYILPLFNIQSYCKNMVKYYIYIQYISNIIRYYSIYFSIFYPYVIHIFHIFSHLFPSFFKDYNAFLRHETLRVAVLQLFDEAEERLAEAEAAAAAEARQRKHPKSAGGFHGKRMKKVDFA